MKPKVIVTIILVLLLLLLFAWLARDNNIGGLFSTPTPSIINTFTLTNTSTSTSTVTFTPTATLTPSATPTFTPTPLVCSQPLTPENGTEFGTSAKVTFSWTAMDTAASYILNITMPSGDVVPFEGEVTEIIRYIEAFTQGGEYKWNVTTLDMGGSQICISASFTFTKPETVLPESTSSSSSPGCTPNGQETIVNYDYTGPNGENCTGAKVYDSCGSLLSEWSWGCGGNQ